MTAPDEAGQPTLRTLRIPGMSRAYRWEEPWGETGPADVQAWAHPGLVASSSGGVLVVDAARPAVRVLAEDGQLLRTIPLPVAEAHGLALDPTGEQAWLWVADPGFKLRVRGPDRVTLGPGTGRVLALDQQGREVLDIGVPPHPAYREQPFKPTAMCFVGPPGDRTIWVADGYGASLVHRYRTDGTYLGSIAGGDEDALRFQTPHALYLDERGAEPEVLVTDRIGRRLQAFDLDGRFRRTVAAGELTSPSAIARLEDLLIVAELKASLAVLDPDGRLIGRIGDRSAAAEQPDWPNARDAAGDLVRSPAMQPGGFQAPHGLAVGADGSIYVAEFVLGGRVIRLRPG